MSYFLKSLTVVLLGAVSVSTLTAPMLPLAATQNAPPASCHQHSHNPPARQPASYVCCLVGHDSAVPLASFSPRTALEEAAGFELCAPLIQTAGLGVVKSLPLTSGDPPGTTPLRI